MNVDSKISTWETAVVWLPSQPEGRQLVLDAFYDDPLIAAAERVDTANELIQAFVAEDDRRARLASQAASAPPGPLHGVPVGIKDIVRVDGLPTRAGSALPPEVLAGEQATVVNRLAAAGALVLGKTVTAEFAAFAPGPTRNPRNIEHTPGGSSSGSAAAVAEEQEAAEAQSSAAAALRGGLVDPLRLG